ncbi:MAG: HEAT repeat domain-containing protein, partial [Gemmatimonadales bacterium]
AQSAAGQGTEPAVNGRPLHEGVAELKAPAPSTRNAAAYAIAGMGADAAAAVPALIEALDDPAAAVRFPVTVALSEIGPGAGAAVPRLLVMVDEDFNDEVAAAARRAIRHIKPEALQGH